MANKVISTLAVGSSVYLNVGGVKKEFLVVHQGLPSSLYDASCDGTWLLMKDVYENRKWHNSGLNSYKESGICTYLNSTFLGMFDSDIQNLIKQVKIPYVNGIAGAAVASGADGLSCKIFLLSGYEVGWTEGNNSWFPVDGACLAYFDGTAVTDAKRIGYRNATAARWWLRSPSKGSQSNSWYVHTNGGPAYYVVTTSYGIRPCIILPSTTLVDDSGNVVTVDLTAHKTLVGGTAYTVQGGKCMVNGTVYNILKGRTLIDGTAWDITFPEPLVMPVKGDLITMNLDGTDRQYRVLKIVGGTTVEVLGMWNESSSVAFGSNRLYNGSTLDTRYNTSWYNSLPAKSKNAIVPKDIMQYEYAYTSNAYSDTHRSYAGYNTKTLLANVGKRYVYVLDIEDIEMYFGGAGGSASDNTAGIFSQSDLWELFWNTTSKPSNIASVWTRSAYKGTSGDAWSVNLNNGFISSSGISSAMAVRPAFQIDLSKIDFTIN